jgi:hypothetical protein
MLFQLHEWDIHIVCRGAQGVRVTYVGSRTRAAAGVVIELAVRQTSRQTPGVFSGFIESRGDHAPRS